MADIAARIALAVDKRGKWFAYGYTDGDDGVLMGACMDDLEQGVARYFVTVTVPLPSDPIEIYGTIEPAP